MPLFAAAAKHLHARRTTLRAVALCAGMVLAQAVSAAPAALRVGDQSGLVQTLLQAAGEAQTPTLPLSWHPFPAGPALLEALSAGAVDVGVVGNAPPVFAQAGGFDIRIIGVADGAQNNNALLLPQGSTVQQVADLKGRRVAVAKGSSGHYLLLAALRQAGLSPREVKIAYASPIDAQNAFASGHLDAWAVWYRFVGQSTAHPDAWAQALAGSTRLPLELVREMLAHQHLRYVPIDPSIIALQQRLADAFAAERLIPKPLQVEQVFDSRFNSLLPQPD